MSFTRPIRPVRPVRLVLLALLALSALVGCGPKETQQPAPTPKASAPAPSVGAPLGTVKVGDKAICTVCAAGNSECGVEEVKATLDYKEKTYAFCSEAEKAEFISDPAKYAGGE